MSCVQWLSPIRYQPKEGLHSVPTAGLQQGPERHRSGWTTQTRGHQPCFFYHVSTGDTENTDSVKWTRATSLVDCLVRECLCCRVKDEVLREVQGMLVSYKVIVRMIASGWVRVPVQAESTVRQAVLRYKAHVMSLRRQCLVLSFAERVCFFLLSIRTIGSRYRLQFRKTQVFVVFIQIVLNQCTFVRACVFNLQWGVSGASFQVDESKTWAW